MDYLSSSPHGLIWVNELNGRFEVGLAKMDRMFALMEQLVKTSQSVKEGANIRTPLPNPGIEPGSPNVNRALFSPHKKPPPPPPLPDNEVLGLVKEKFAKESIIRTANSTVQLSTINGEFFVAKFMDYLESLGLKQAVLATRSQCIDPKNNKETEKVNKSRINILRTHKKAAWEEAHLQLKSLLTTEMYKELVINKDKEGTQDFFDLWDLCLQETEKKKTNKDKGKNEEEIPLVEPYNENIGEEKTELANAVHVTINSRFSREKSCSFCKRRGHTVEECRTKKYSGFAVLNKNCKQWVMNGRCTWEIQTGKPCKFEHNRTRNTKTWEANSKRSD